MEIGDPVRIKDNVDHYCGLEGTVLYIDHAGTVLVGFDEDYDGPYLFTRDELEMDEY